MGHFLGLGLFSCYSAIPDLLKILYGIREMRRMREFGSIDRYPWLCISCIISVSMLCLLVSIVYFCDELISHFHDRERETSSLRLKESRIGHLLHFMVLRKCHDICLQS